MEHIELAGVHSGDSACLIPTRTVKSVKRIEAFMKNEIVPKALQEYYEKNKEA